MRKWAVFALSSMMAGAMILMALGVPAPQAAHAAPPSSITIDSPADGATTGSGILRLSGTYTGLYEIKLYIDGTTQVDAMTSDPDGDDSGTWAYNLDTSKYNGTVQIRARGLDTTTRYGIWSPTIQVHVNNPAASKPQVAIVSPAEGVPLSGIVPIRVEATSGAAITRVEVRIDGGAWQQAAFDGTYYSLDWDTTAIGDKTSSIEARAYNANGAKGLSMTTYAQVGAGTHEAVVMRSHDRAMWIWEAASYNLLLNPGSREVLDAMAKDTATFDSDPVTVFYFAVGTFDGMDVMEDRPDLLRDFISWAHERGYQVYACIAAGTSPPYMGAYREFHDTAIRHFEQVLNYNIASGPDERFDGVNVDIEPYISPDFSALYPSLQIQYLEMTEKMIERRNAAGLNLPYGPAIPKWYDSSDRAKDIAYNGQTKWLSEHVQDLSDYISIMDYRDTADGSAGIIEGARGEIAYANAIGKPNSVVIGVETKDIANSGDPETITFREEGRTAMEAELDKVYAAFGSEPSFGGIAMHHYDTIRALPSDWGPDGVLWQPPADSEPPTALSAKPAATAIDYQSIALKYGRAYDNTEVDQYIIYRSTESGFTPGPANAIGTARSLIFTDTGLLPATTYYYKVAAVDVQGHIGPASEQAKATTGTTHLKPMIITSLKVEPQGSNASAVLQVADMNTLAPLSANVEGRFTHAGGKYVSADAADGRATLTSEAIPAGFQVGFEPRRITADGYYWAQAYDRPHAAVAFPRVQLQNLAISEGSFSVPFTPGQAHYTAVVDVDTARLHVTATAGDPAMAIRVNGVPVGSGELSQAIPLAPGDNVIVVQTTGKDATTDSYTMTVIRQVPIDNVFIASEDAHVFQNEPSRNDGSSPYLDVLDITNADGGGDKLVYLKFDTGAWIQAVDSVTLNVYSPQPTSKNVKIDVIGYPADDWKEGTIVFNNRPLKDPVPIRSFTVRESGWYAIDVTEFARTQIGPDHDRTITLRFIINDIPNSSGELVQFHSRDNGSNPPYLLINPSSDASLAHLALSAGQLEPAFDPDRFLYTATVSDDVYGIQLTPTVSESHARITMNGQPVVSGQPSDVIALQIGPNGPVVIQVTAQDGTLQEYEVLVHQVLSDNADLRSLSLLGAELDRPFSAEVTAYMASVSAGIESVRLAAEAADSGASVWVNDVPLNADGLSQSISLNPGRNDISVRVQARNGDSKVYAITVTVEAGGDPGGPTEPTDPTEPTEPTDPADPADPADSSDPATPGTGSAGGPSEPGTPSPDVQTGGNGTIIRAPSVPAVDENGQPAAKVALDASTLLRAVEALRQQAGTGASPVVTIEVDDQAPSTIVDMPLEALDRLSQVAGAVLSVRAGQASHQLPAAFVDPAAVAASLGVQPEQIQLRVTVRKLDDEQASDWLGAARAEGGSIIGSVYDFRLTAHAGDKSLPLDDFGYRYFTSTLDWPAADLPEPGSYLTAVTIDPATGALVFVPAKITAAEGRMQAAIQRTHNGPVAIVQLRRSFADTQGHWAQQAVERLASKLVAQGVADDRFAPDREITRAEFVALLVRTLGLAANSNSAATEAAYGDVLSTDWHAGAIAIASDAGLVRGFSDGSFRPNRSISREELAVLIAQAMDFASPSPSTDGADRTLASAGFKDADRIAPWAQEAVQRAAQAGLMIGYPDETFAPHERATRAQAAVLLQQLALMLGFM